MIIIKLEYFFKRNLQSVFIGTRSEFDTEESGIATL